MTPVGLTAANVAHLRRGVGCVCVEFFARNFPHRPCVSKQNCPKSSLPDFLWAVVPIPPMSTVVAI